MAKYKTKKPIRAGYTQRFDWQISNVCKTMPDQPLVQSPKIFSAKRTAKKI